MIKTIMKLNLPIIFPNFIYSIKSDLRSHVLFVFCFSFAVNCAGAKDASQCGTIRGIGPGTAMCKLDTTMAMKNGGPTIPEMCPGTCGYCKSEFFFIEMHGLVVCCNYFKAIIFTDIDIVQTFNS